METLDPSSHEPLYSQLADRLRTLLRDGVFAPGQRLPSEKELVDEFGVSRSTAIAAIDELVRAHLAHRIRGKGTFASKPVISEFSLAVGFTEDLRRRGLRPGTRTLSVASGPPDPGVVARFGAPAGPPYHAVARVRLADDEPVALQHAYLPAALYPDLERHSARLDELYRLMREVYGHFPQWAEAVVEVRLATPDEATHLEITVRDPVALVWHLTLDTHYRPLEYVRSVYRADRFTFASGRQRVGPEE